MKTETDKESILSAGNATSFGSVVVRDLLNVTWRMLIPTLLGVAAGYWLGDMLGNKTIGFLVGAVLGFAAGVYLALRLLNAVKEHNS